MKLPRLKVGDAIEVIWIDSHYRADKGWMSEEDVDDGNMVTIRSVCIYIGKDADYLHTVSDRSEDMSGVMRDLKLPIGCLKAITKLAKKGEK